jgi:hypothetical protein
MFSEKIMPLQNLRAAIDSIEAMSPYAAITEPHSR